MTQMNDGLRNQALSLGESDRFDLMMALFDSLSDSDLPVFSESRLLDLEKLVSRYRSYPDPSVSYDKVIERLRSRGA
jgi:hypothetical protein